MPNPPSFEPESRPPRPSAHGARRVGTGTFSSAASSAHGDKHGTPPQSPSRVPLKRSFNEDERALRSSERESYRAHFSYRDGEHGSEQLLAIQPPAYTPHAKLRSAIPEHPQTQPHSPRTYPPHAPSSGQFQPRKAASAASQSFARRKPKITLHSTVSAVALVLAFAIIATLCWGMHLINYGNSQLTRLDILSDRKGTAGTTYLIVGSDERGKTISDDADGQRADTIMLLHKPRSGNASLISLPRDAWVPVEGYGNAKLNASFSWGGQKLLVQTVQNYTGLTIDHYVQIGMDGVKDLTDAVGGVNLCLKRSSIISESISEDSAGNSTLVDPESALTWSWTEGEEESCQNADGDTALAFSRMRKADVAGDIGRGLRQRQVIGAIMNKAFTREIILSPSKQKTLVGAVASVLTVDDDDSITNVAFAGLDLKNAMSNGISGAPPIADIAYWTDDGQSAVLLDRNKHDIFWQKVLDGSITQADFYNPLR
ncbi:Membrane-bound protein lytR [Chlamydia trachomatis]|nr:Membrane-bound protein lytR [Chlamydia trachomatis]